jgi:hypothetical protein
MAYQDEHPDYYDDYDETERDEPEDDEPTEDEVLDAGDRHFEGDY